MNWAARANYSTYLKQAPLAIIAAYNEPDIFPQILLRLLKEVSMFTDRQLVVRWHLRDYKTIASDSRGAISIERFLDSGPVRHFELRQILSRNEEIGSMA